MRCGYKREKSGMTPSVLAQATKRIKLLGPKLSETGKAVGGVV